MSSEAAKSHSTVVANTDEENTASLAEATAQRANTDSRSVANADGDSAATFAERSDVANSSSSTSDTTVATVEATATAVAESNLGTEVAKAEKVADRAQKKLPRIIIGSGIAKKLKVGVGDVVTMMIMGNQGESGDNLEAIESSLKAPERKKALIVGTIHLGGQLDGTLALMNVDDVLELADLRGPNAIHIRTADLKNTNYIIYGATSGKIKENANLSTWMNSQGKLYHDIQMVRQIMFIAMFLVLAVACFNIVSNLMMMTGERRREIAILLTMGMKPVQIVRTFSIMGIITGAYGTVIGLVLGIVVSLGVTPFTASFRDWFGFDLLNEDVYFINFIPSHLSLIDVLIVTAAALLMSWLAALYPAVRASRVQPAQELNL